MADTNLTFSGTTASGYAAVFDTWTTVAGLYKERIAKGAFSRTLRESPDVLALWNHNYDQVLGRTTAGTLRLSEDAKGLRFELDLDPRSPVGALALSTLDRGDVAGCSFGFRVGAQEWEDSGSGLPRRTLTDLWLWEVTLTPIPAYEDTSVSLRAANAANARRRILERLEREQRLRGIAA